MRKENKFKFLRISIFLFGIFFIQNNAFCLSDIPSQQDVLSVIMNTDSQVLINFKNYAYENTVLEPQNYVFKDGYGSLLDSSVCSNLDDYGHVISANNISYNNLDRTAYITLNCLNTTDGSSKLDIDGDYQVCIKNIANNYGYGDPMSSEGEGKCFSFKNSTIVTKVDFNTNIVGSNNIKVVTNGTIDSNKVSYGNYIFKYENGSVLNGNNIFCYGYGADNPLHPSIDENGKPDISSVSRPVDSNVIDINIGCSLPEGHYKLCLSNIEDTHLGLSTEEQCVYFDPAPNLTDVKMLSGSDKIIKLFFDTNVANIENSDITFKDMSGNPIKINDNIDSNGHPNYSFYSNSECNHGSQYDNVYNDNYGCYGDYNGDKTFVMDFSLDNERTDIDAKYQYKYTFPIGEYQVCVKNIKAFGFGGYVPMSEQCKTFVVDSDITPPVLYYNPDGLISNKNFYASKNKIIVKYSEPMGNSAIDKANYMIKDFGYGVSTITSWTKLSNIQGSNIYFSDSSKKNISISLPNNISLVSSSTDFFIGDGENPNDYLIKDSNGNNFIETIYGNNFVAIENFSTMGNMDISSSNGVDGIKNVTIKSPTTIEFKFDREINNVDEKDFIIKNNTNSVGFTPLSAIINEDDKTVITFTISNSNKFTSLDDGDKKKNVQLSIIDNPNTLDMLGLKFSSGETFTVNNNIIFRNSLVKPYIKSVKQGNGINTITIGIAGGKMKDSYDNLFALADSIIIYQDVNGVRKSVSGWSDYTDDGYNNYATEDGKISFYYNDDDPEYYAGYYDEINNISYFDGIIGMNINSNYPFYIASYGYGDEDVKTFDDVSLISNANPIQGTSNILFFNGAEANLSFNSGSNNIKEGTNFVTYFNKRLDLSSISSGGGWKMYKGDYDYDQNSNCSNFGNNCYIKRIKNGIVFDSLTNRVTFPGTNIGEIYDRSGITIKNGTSFDVSDLVVIYNGKYNTVYLFIDSDADVEMNVGDVITYMPGNSLKTISGQYINDINYFNIPFYSVEIQGDDGGDGGGME